MPEYLAPGVYIEEVDTGNKPIEGVATSTVGFVGITERGPVDEPRLVTSFSEFVRTFGRYVENRYLPHAVEGFFQNGGKRAFIARVVAGNATIALQDSDAMTVRALGHGNWPNGRLAIKVSRAGLHNDSNPRSTELFRLNVMYWQPGITLPDEVVDPTDPQKATDPNRVEPTILETFDNLSADSRSSSFYERQVNDRSVLVLVRQKPGTGRPPDLEMTFFEGGANGDEFTADHFNGDPGVAPGERRGFAALEEIDEIAILACPDENQFVGVTERMIQQCETLKDRFAITQAPQTAPLVANHRPPSTIVSKYAAYYYPWLKITHPVTGVELEIPPGGHVAGIFARSDIERGVHKAPANEIVRGIQDLQFQITKGQQDLLNPRGVNVIRYFPGRGNLVWGARTTTLDPDWRYVNVRRLFIFVEESIEEATQWVVFEPNDEPLWARVRRSVGDFLTRIWREGMLQGRTREEAYFVKCDRTTMTQADIDLGRLIVLIGIAPVKPAEFVIFRIGQWTGGSEVSEG